MRHPRPLKLFVKYVQSQAVEQRKADGIEICDFGNRTETRSLKESGEPAAFEHWSI